jgi:hypothetical protein
MKLVLATHQASIATVTQMTDGTGIKELRDDADPLRRDGSETFGD